MGEAKRRKQLLGSKYGKPLGLSSAERIDLIEQNIEGWISEHFDNCEYYNYLEKPFNMETRPKDGESGFGELLEKLMKHFSSTFNQEYPDESIRMLVLTILSDQPMIFEGVSLEAKQRMEPTIPLPQARKYFQEKVKQQKIRLPAHYILVKEALTVLGHKEKAPLLRQLFWGEFNEVIESAQEEEASWMMKNLNADGWIDLTEELVLQSANRVKAGILTIVATLPWEMQLDFVLPLRAPTDS